mgnify:CR=1 FL=1
MSASLLWPELEFAERFSRVLDKWSDLAGGSAIGYDKTIYSFPVPFFCSISISMSISTSTDIYTYISKYIGERGLGAWGVRLILKAIIGYGRAVSRALLDSLGKCELNTLQYDHFSAVMIRILCFSFILYVN